MNKNVQNLNWNLTADDKTWILFFTSVFCRFCVNKVLLYPVPKTIMLLLCFHFSEIQLQGNSAKETNKLCKKLLTYLPLFPDFSTNKVSSETKSTDLNFPKVFCDCFFTNLFLFPSISYYFHIPKNFLIFFPHTGKNRNRRKSNLLP